MYQHDLTLPASFHVKALAAAVLLHTGVAAWMVAPSEAVAIPIQQVIQVSMVAPSSVAQAAKPQEKVEETSKVPPKPDGMKKVQEQKQEKAEAITQEKPQEASVEKLTSGQVSKDSELEHSAVTEPVFNAEYLKNQPPAYPESARRRGKEGKVMLEVLVSADGMARDVRVISSSGSSLLDDAARSAVSRWQFVPGRRGSERVETTVNVPIVFNLKGKS
jgi:periplasmic protein TonB